MVATHSIIVLLLALVTPESQQGAQQVRIPITSGRAIDLEVLIGRLAEATGQTVARRPGPVEIPIIGPAGALNRRWIAKDLGPETSIAVEGSDLVITLGAGVLEPARRADWQRRLEQIAARARSRGQATAGVWDARPGVVPAQRPGAADGLPGPRPELVVGGVRPHDPPARGGRATAWSSTTIRSTGAWRSRAHGSAATGPSSAARGRDPALGDRRRTRWGRWWRGRTSRTPRLTPTTSRR